MPWSWSYRWLWTTLHGYMKLNSSPLQEQCISLTAKASSNPKTKNFLHYLNCLIHLHMYMCVYACLWWYRVTYTQIGTSGGQRLFSGVVPQVLYILFLKTQFLAHIWHLSIMSVWLARETPEFFWLHLPTSMFTRTCHYAWLFT